MNSFVEWLVSILLVVGASCALLAAVGLLRMPDLFTRLQASSKAATLGAILLFIATAFHFGGGPVAVKSIVVILFLALTTPVGAHKIARASYLAGERMTDPDALDEWSEHRPDSTGGAPGGREP